MLYSNELNLVNEFTFRRREDIDNLPNEHHGYLFDLDCTEIKDDENLGEKYTVDSYFCGTVPSE